MKNATVSTPRLGVLALIPLALYGCGGSSDTSSTADTFEPVVPSFALVFEDNFDGTDLDRSKWNIQTGDGCAEGICGWGNNEQQIYTDSNFRVENGSLIIEGRVEPDGSYSSARLNTRDNVDFRYGRVEVRAKLPAGLGTWPAVWMLPTDSVYGTWPLSGEIDIMEAINLGAPGFEDRVFSTTHYGLPFPQNTFVSESFDDFDVPPQDGFHVYEVEWQAGQLRFFVDGVHYHSQNSDNWYTYGRDANGVASLIDGDAPFDQRFHILLNLALGGNLPGTTIDESALPAQFEIDYVRVYECDGADPDTARGCGRASASVDIQEAPSQPYQEQLGIYTDGIPTLSLASADNSVATNTLVVAGTGIDGGVITVNDPAASDPATGGNLVWNVGVSGGLGEVFLRSQDLSENLVLETGFDLSGSEDAGQIVFDMKVNSLEPGTTFSAGLRTDANAFALVPINPMPTTPGSFITYAVNIGDLVNAVATRNGSNPIDLENILDIFLFQINGTADVFLDNIRITTACREVGDCTATLNFKSLPFDVFTDAVAPIWSRGIGAADNSTGFVDYFTGDGAGNKVNWEIRPADDPTRGQILDVTFTDKDDFAVWFIQTASSVPLNAYATGSVVFDINVLDYGQNTAGMTMKIDCIFPCTSGDQQIGMVGANGWEEVRVPVAQLVNSGLSLETVNTGLVLFPTDQVGEINFLVDNIRWEPPRTRQDVFFDDVDPTWNGGIGAADSGSDFATYRDGMLQGAKVNWRVITDGDPLRAQVVEVTFNDSAENGVWFIDALEGVDISTFERGRLVFNLNVVDYGSNTSGMVVKVDCFFPCTSGEFPLGRIADGQWEQVTIPVADLVAGGLDLTTVNAGIVLFPTTGDQGDVVFRVDEVRFEVDEEDAGPALLTQPVLPITFEDDTVDYSFIDFEGTFTALVEDPEDPNNTVARTDRGAGSATFAGTVIGRGTGLGEPVPFDATTTQITMRVYSPAAGIPVRMKAENVENSALAVETETLTTVANEWETLTFDFDNEAQPPALDLDVEYNQLIVFFNFGSGNAPDQTFFWDDVSIGGGGFTPLDQIDLPITFDEENTDYSVIDFEGTFTTVGNDPLDASNQVAITTRGAGSATFAGTVIGTEEGLDNPVPFTASQSVISMRVFAPAPGIPVRLKVENLDNAGQFADAQVNTTVGNQWETLLFDFSNPVAGALDLSVDYEQLVLFFNFDTAGADAGEQIFRWDDVAFGEPPPPADTTPPVLTTVSIASSNADPTLATGGDVLTIAIVANEAIEAPVVTFGGVAADAVTGDATMWTATRTLPGTTLDGGIAVTVAAIDLAGNAAATVSATTDGSAVTFDGTAPTVTIAGAPVAIDTDDPLTLTVTFSEPVTGFDATDVTVTNASVDSVTTTDDTEFALTLVPDGSEMDIAVSLAASVATDAAGNPNSAATDVNIQYGFTPMWAETFADDFDGAALDTNTWTIDVGDGCPDNCGWGNGELQSYAADNVSIDSGSLVLEARDEGGMTYTSGRVNTRGAIDLRYGRIEVRARMPEGTGTWPSITLLPTDEVYGAYPASGEITLIQARNLGTGGESDVYPQLEFGLPMPETSAIGQAVAPGVAVEQDFNTYAIEWEDGEIRWFLNDVHVQTQTSDGWYAYVPDADGVNELVAGSAPFDQTFHIVLAFALGGDFAGAPDMTTPLPQRFEIDSVRVFTCENGDPATGRGCSTGDAGIMPIDAPNAPYTESIEVYTNAAGVNAIDVNGQMASNTLSLGSLTDGMATVTTDPATPDPDDGANTLWATTVAGGTGGVRADSEDLESAVLLTSGFDLSGADVAGQLLFDLRLNSAGAGAMLTVDMRSSDTDLVRLPVTAAVGDWQTVAVNLSDLQMSMDMLGDGLSLDNVFTPFALEVSGGDAAFDVDNVRVVAACREEGNCRARPRVRSEVGVEPRFIYDDEVAPEWNQGIGASDAPSFLDYFDGNTANVFNWQIVTEAMRGNVIEVTANDIGTNGVWFITSDTGVDLTGYEGGQLSFDLNVVDYGGNVDGLLAKVDCFFPCTSGDRELGRIADGVWEQVTFTARELTRTGLDLSNVNAGIVIFPGNDAADYAGDVVYRVDNVRWEAGPYDLPISFDLPATDHTFEDADGQTTVRAVDPGSSANAVARTTRAADALATASTTVQLDAPVPFNSIQTAIGVDVLAPANGLPVRLRLGSTADAAAVIEAEAMTGMAGAFETLMFDFETPLVGTLDLNATYDIVTLLFDAGTAGAVAGEQVWYWDNVEFLPVPGLTVVDNFEDGDASNWSVFQGPSAGGGCTAVNIDAVGQPPAEGSFYLNTGWGGNGTASGFYGGCTLAYPTSNALPLPDNAYLNLFIRNEQTTTPFVDGYTLEIILREDPDGNGYTPGTDDELVASLPYTVVDFTADWVYVSIPLTDFVVGSSFDDGVIEGGVAEFTLGIAGIDGAPGTSVEVDFDYINFTSGPGLPPTQ